MKKITFELPKRRQIEVNGIVFDVFKSDSDVLAIAADMHSKGAWLADKEISTANVDQAFKFVSDITQKVDIILGKGAIKKIVKDTPLGINDAINLLTAICEGVISAYNEEISAEYE